MSRLTVSAALLLACSTLARSAAAAPAERKVVAHAEVAAAYGAPQETNESPDPYALGLGLRAGLTIEDHGSGPYFGITVIRHAGTSRHPPYFDPSYAFRQPGDPSTTERSYRIWGTFEGGYALRITSWLIARPHLGIGQLADRSFESGPRTREGSMTYGMWVYEAGLTFHVAIGWLRLGTEARYLAVPCLELFPTQPSCFRETKSTTVVLGTVGFALDGSSVL